MELKPCPFCGGKSIRINAYGFGKYAAECNSCHVVTAMGFGTYVVDFNGETVTKGEEEAIEAWNRRADDGKTD